MSVDKETIHDRLIGPDYKMPDPDGVREDVLEKRGNEVSLEVHIPDSDPTINLVVNKTPIEDESVLKAKRFLELIENGDKPSEAVRKVDSRSTVTKLIGNTKDVDLKAKLKKLIEIGRMPAELRKEMVRSFTNTALLENMDGNLREKKYAMDAAKLIAADPEVGLNTPIITPGVTIDLGKFAEILSNMKPIEGLETFIEGDKE